MASTDGTLPETGLHKGTNWWGAFVIVLAGTILVTGIAPYVAQGTGALGIILIGVMTIAGCFLCLCLAELATMWPDRTGGIPGYATESFRPLVGETTARHLGGVSGWAYWLGWFPVAPINVILTASYLAVLFNFSPGHTIDPVGTTWGAPIGITIVLLCFGLVLLSAARDKHREVVEPALSFGGVAQALDVIHGVVGHEADDAVADILAAGEAIGDAAEGGVD